MKTSKFYRRTAAFWLLAFFCAPLPRSFALDFSRLERWAGEGTNRAALVIDWNDGTRAEALAWGFRWNGEATALDLWQAVTIADQGLTGSITNEYGDIRLTGIEYRRTVRPGDLLPATGQHNVYRTAYARDYTGEVFRAGLWHEWSAVNTSYVPAVMTEIASSLHDVSLTNNTWLAFSFTPASETETRRPGYALPAVNYPFATSVRAYNYGVGTAPFDWVDSVTPFDDALVALGRPTVDTTGEWDEPGIPVVPVQPAFRAFELVSIGDGGFIELAFDHPVVDHPDNPHGRDFIVFGNGFQNLKSGRWTNGSPHLSTAGTNGNYEAALVSVSQDGERWFSFTNGPYADDFAPTLGRVYDPSRVETNLGAWNLWWGGPTDPTLPLDPALSAFDWLDLTVAEISARYRGSAGGTAFDISGLDLASDPASGLKWIRYVRIERMGDLNPEVDAVADVSPVMPYDRWRMEQFAWLDDPQDEHDDVDADGDGAPTLLEYALASDPRMIEAQPIMPMAIDDNGRPQVMMPVVPPDVRLMLQVCHDLSNPDWCDEATAPSGAPSHRFYRLGVRHE